MIFIKTKIPKELSLIDDKHKAIYHSNNRSVFLYLKQEKTEMSLSKDQRE